MNYKTIVSLAALALLTFTASTVNAEGIDRVELNKGWTFKQVRGNNWYPATVPGVVQTDLMANQLIEDPFFRLNEKSIQWVDKEDWDYKTTFDVPSEMFNKECIELDFKGLDTYADVYLNDSCILRANNMFREWRVNVKGLLKQSDNTMRIRFNSPIRVDLPKFDALKYPIEAGNDQSENGGILNKKLSVFARKAGYHYGWDWGPRIVTSGIWRPVFLDAWNNLRIDNVFYRQNTVNKKRADIMANVTIVADKAGEATVRISADGVKNVWTAKAQLKSGVNTIAVPVTLNNPHLWWSNGLGEQYLYNFHAAVSFNGTQADDLTTKLGVRSLKIINKPDASGHTFYVELNGVPVFAKGANYIPQDNFLPRVTPEKYEKTILDARNANMNMLRVWGGGIYENDLFYDLCDKYGILIWQDFMFACSIYPMDDAQLANVRQEAIDNITRMRNHACLALWCGNNENHTAWFNWGWMNEYKQLGVLDQLRKEYKEVFHELLPSVMKEYNPTAFYWPSSPYGGNPDAPAEVSGEVINANGDAHYWGVWHGKDSIANFNVKKARFFAEYGFQSFPEYQSVLKYAPEERDHNIYSDVMMAHQRGGSEANALIEWYLLNEYRKPKDFQNFLYMGQLLQGDAIKTAIEAHRRQMPFNMGTLFWQHDDCWPVASWSSRDFYGRWKAQHYFARKAYEDILVSPIQDSKGNLNIYFVSDRLTPAKGKLNIRVMDLNGKVVFDKTMAMTAPANTSKNLFTAPLSTLLGGKQKNEVVVAVRFTDNAGKVYTNNYFLTRYKDISFPKANVTLTSKEAQGGFDVTAQSDVFARGVFLSINGIDNFFSDNYFDLIPGEPVTIHVTTTLSKADFDSQLRSENIADAY